MTAAAVQFYARRTRKRYRIYRIAGRRSRLVSSWYAVRLPIDLAIDVAIDLFVLGCQAGGVLVVVWLALIGLFSL